MGKRGKKKRGFQHITKSPEQTRLPDIPLPALPELPPLPEFKLNGSDATGPLRDADEGGWQEVKRPKKLKERPSNGPSFQMSPMRIKHKLKVKELQELCLWLLSAGKAPQWLIVNNKPEIQRVVVLLVPGLTIDMFNGSRNMHEIPGISAMDVEEEDVGVPLTRDDVPDAALDTPKNLDLDAGATPEPATTRAESPLPPMSTFTDIVPLSLVAAELPECLKPLADVFRHVWPSTIGGPDDKNRVPSPVTEMLSLPLDKTARKQLSKAAAFTNSKGFDQYLMSFDELLEDDFPLHSLTLSEIRQLGGAIAQDTEKRLVKFMGDGWTETEFSADATWKSSLEASPDARCLAIDCEMVKTTVGSELARVSIVDFSGTVLYDKLVKPSNPVVDHLTQFSGITEEMLRDVKLSLPDVQAELISLIKETPATIIVGHSINSDLEALKLRHPFLIDTSVIFDHPRGKPYKPSLKWLAKRYLKKDVQTGGKKGHDSIEDAKTCIDLLKMKIAKGSAFGKFEDETEPIFKQLALNGKVGRVVDWGNPTKFHGSLAESCVHCSSDEDVVEGLKQTLSGSSAPPDFTWARLHDLEVARGFRTNDRTETVHHSLESRTAVTHQTCDNIQKVYDSLPGGTAFIVYSGSGDPRQMRKYLAMQKQFREDYKVKKWDDLDVRWTDDEEQLLKQGVKRAKEGVSFLTVKPVEKVAAPVVVEEIMAIDSN